MAPPAGHAQPESETTLVAVRALTGQRVVLRPIGAADAPALRTIHALPEVVRWWGLPEDDFPFGDDPDATRFAIVCDGETAGLIQYGEELEPSYRYAWIDIFVDPRRQRRGLGTDAIATLVRYLVEEHGHPSRHDRSRRRQRGRDPLLRDGGISARRRDGGGVA